MKIAVTDFSSKHVGCVCLLEYRTSEWGFTGHSQSRGLEGSGQVASTRNFLGRLCMVTPEKLHFLTWVESSHPMTLSWSLGPHIHEDGITSASYIFGIPKERILPESISINLEESSNDITELLNSEEFRVWNLGAKLARRLPSV